MNTDILFALIFYGLLILFYILYKKRFVTQGKIFVLYKTKLGLKLMDRCSKIWPKGLKFLGDVGIFVGFIGMITMFYILVKGTFNLIFVPEAQPVVSPVLPGLSIPGLPSLGFWHWILAIFIVAVIHEFSHGVYARLAKIKINSSGFAFLGPILAAFVEPDEKSMEKKTKREQLRVFAAGPFGNIILFVIVFLIAGFLINPFVSAQMESQGVKIVGIEENAPLFETGVSLDEKVVMLNGINILNTDDFLEVAKELKPNQETSLVTLEGGEYSFETITHPDDVERGYMGVSVNAETVGFKESSIEKYGKGFLSFMEWLATLFFWLYVISFGIGLFNLLPLGPVDGGRMLYTSLLFFIKEKHKAKKIWGVVGFICVALIIINLLPYFIKLFMSLVHLFV